MEIPELWPAIQTLDAIKLAGGRRTQISPEDYKHLARFACVLLICARSLCVAPDGPKAERWQGGVRDAHRSCAVMGLRFRKGLQVDHINHDTLDNRRENLRLATLLQQTCNQQLRSNNTTGVKGVLFNKHVNRYHAYVAIGGRPCFREYFADAGRSRDGSSRKQGKNYTVSSLVMKAEDETRSKHSQAVHRQGCYLGDVQQSCVLRTGLRHVR